MLGCDQIITLIKCDGENYAATVFNGVSWFDKTRVITEDTGLVFFNASSIRIPADVIPVDSPLPEVGDHVIRGLLSAGATLEKPADLAPYHPRKVMSVGDNRRGGLPHLAVICQ